MEDEKQYEYEIAFSASGGAFSYQLGIACYLQQRINLDNVAISGCSGGAWPAVLLASKTDIPSTWTTMQNISKDMYSNSWQGGYGTYYRAILRTCETIWEQSEQVYLYCNDRLSIAVTKFPSMRAECHTSWTSNADVANSVVCSAMLPFAMNGSIYHEHRGERYCDGGITNFRGIKDLSCGYTTWSDLYYHTTSSVIQGLRHAAYSLSVYTPIISSQNIVAMLECSLPEIVPPPAQIAQLATNRLLITPWMWRSQHPLSFHLSVNIEHNVQMFQDGFDDALANHSQIVEALGM